jgi:LacI family transcriptional regulator
MGHMAITQKDIARYLNIDPSAVSYALNGTGTGSDTSRQQILEAAQKLGYRPNILARSIRTGKTGTIGVLLGGDFQKQSEQLRHTEQSAREQGYHLVVAHGVSHVRHAEAGEIIETELNQLDRFVQFQVDGVVIQTAVIYLSEAHQKKYWDRVRHIMPKGLPVVAFDSPGDHDFTQVFVDRFQWGQKAALALCERGYQNLTYVGSKTSLFSKQIYRGLQSVSEINCSICEVEVTDSQSVFKGHRAVGLFRKGSAQVLVAANARIAHGLLIGLLEKGIRVPHDVSLVALDQSEMLQWPPRAISSFEYRNEALGKETWEVMHQLLEDEKPNPKTDRDYNLVARETLQEIV